MARVFPAAWKGLLKVLNKANEIGHFSALEAGSTVGLCPRSGNKKQMKVEVMSSPHSI